MFSAMISSSLRFFKLLNPFFVIFPEVTFDKLKALDTGAIVCRLILKTESKNFKLKAKKRNDLSKYYLDKKFSKIYNYYFER